MTTRNIYLFIVMIFSLTLNSCAQQVTASISTEAPSMPTQIGSPLPPVPTTSADQPTSQAQTPVSSTSALIYDDDKNIISVNPDTGETKVLISRSEIKLLLGEDKSADSYTYRHERPVPIDISPDFKKALVAVCLSLDNKFRCLNEYFVYSLEEKIAIRLPKPSDSYGVYWKWSPDGSKLAGAGWTYTGADYEVNRFYSVNSDGTNLTTLSSITNDNWRIAWHPGGAVILPLTYVTNFRSIFVDGSKEVDVLLDSLEWNDKVECLAFSPDLNRVALVVSRDTRNDHHWLYIARSDFADPSIVTEYDIDSRYLCNLDWSPDQSFIHVNYAPDPRVEAGKDQNEMPLLDILVNVENGRLVEPPQNSHVCGWTPDSNLIYEKRGFTGEAVGIDLLDVKNSTPVSLPDNVKTVVTHCPIKWLKDAPVLNIPEGLSVGNACHPGSEIQDMREADSLSSLFDILSVSSSINEEELSVVFSSASASKSLNDYLTPNISEQFLNGWEVLVDVDNNALTGDKLGIDYRFSVVVKPRPDGNPPGLAGVILKFDSSGNKYVSVDALHMLFDPDAASLTLTGKIPGITENSRLIFLSRMVDKMVNSKPVVVGDRICN